jgi:hypothetical protein
VWHGTFTVGTPAKEFRVMFATGSADTWLPSAECRTDGCLAHALYDRNASSTHTEDNTTTSGTVNFTVRVAHSPNPA